MSQKTVLQGLLFLTGLMAGVLLESRYFQARRGVASVAAPVATSTIAQSPSEKPTQAKIQVDDPVFKFGTAETGGKIEHAFIKKTSERIH